MDESTTDIVNHVSDQEDSPDDTDGDEEPQRVYNIPTVCVEEDTSVQEEQNESLERHHQQDYLHDEKEQPLTQLQKGQGEVMDAIVQSDEKKIAEKTRISVETCVDTGLPVRVDEEGDTSVSKHVPDNVSGHASEEISMDRTATGHSVIWGNTNRALENRSRTPELSMPTSCSEDPVAELSLKQLGLDGLDGVSMNNVDTLSLDSRDLVMVMGNAPLAVFTPSSDEMDFEDETISDDVVSNVPSLGVETSIDRVSAKSLYDSSKVLEPVINELVAPGNNIEIESEERDDRKYTLKPVEPVPFFAPTDPWDRFNIKSTKKSSVNLNSKLLVRSMSSPNTLETSKRKAVLGRSLSKDGTPNSITTTASPIPVLKQVKTESPQQEACRRIDQLISNMMTVGPAATRLASTLPQDQQPPPLPPLKDLLGSAMPSLNRSLSSDDTAPSEEPDVSIDEKFVTVRRSKKLSKQHCNSLSSDSELSDLDHSLQLETGQMPDRDKSLSFDLLLEGLNSLGKEINNSIEILAEKSNIDDNLSIDGLLEDNYDEVVLDNVSLKNKVNSQDISLKSINNSTLIEDVADKTLNDSSIYYTPDISINEAIPAKITKKPSPLNVKCGNIEKGEKTLDGLSNESPLYSPSSSLANSKRRFFFEVAQPVRIDPFNPQIGLSTKDKENNHVTNHIDRNDNKQLDNYGKRIDGAKQWCSVDACSSTSGLKRKMEQQKGNTKLQLKKDWKSQDVNVNSPTAGKVVMFTIYVRSGIIP